MTAQFNSVPVQESLRIIRQRLEVDQTLAERTILSPQQITDLLEVCLSTTYFVVDRLEVQHVCEGNEKTINCSNRRILIHSARYGRFDSVTCPHPYMANVGCGTDGVDEIRSRCNGRPICRLEALNNLFTDPCPNTYKYLEVNYTCMMEETTTKALTTITSTSIITTTPATTTELTTTPATTTELTTTPSTNTETSNKPQNSDMTTAVAIVETADPYYITVPSQHVNTSCCACFYKRTNQTCPEGDLPCLLEFLKRELLLKTSTLSLYKRTKISAYDGRTSSAVIGLSGVIIIATALSLIVIPDFIVFLKLLYTKYRKKTKRCPV
ncbi:latrophilin Cirl-like [Argopecten irradians]|uniref:latrophilin Cirl-like n=1 Tax=Argopecten irradians TaxID=31199 RepID=UPI003718FD99